MEFSSPEYWSGNLFPSPSDLSNTGIEPRSPTLQVGSLPAKPPGKPKNTGVGSLSLLHWIFPSQELNWSLLHCRWILYQLSYQGSPNMLSTLVIAFLPRNKHVLISWLQLPSAVILEPTKIKSVTISLLSPSICHEVMGPDAMIFVLCMLSFKPDFSLSSFTFIKRLFTSS